MTFIYSHLPKKDMRDIRRQIDQQSHSKNMPTIGNPLSQLANAHLRHSPMDSPAFWGLQREEEIMDEDELMDMAVLKSHANLEYETAIPAVCTYARQSW